MVRVVVMQFCGYVQLALCEQVFLWERANDNDCSLIFGYRVYAQYCESDDADGMQKFRDSGIVVGL